MQLIGQGKHRLLAIIFIFFISLFFLHKDLYPTVFADEWLYSSSSRLIELTKSVTPSYLYLLLFKNTNYCGTAFLSCARILNILFFTSAAIFIYLIARKVTTRNNALFVVILALMDPVNSYTAYYMPEALYYFFFWFFSWVLLSSSRTQIAGIILGLMSLVKIHAFFLIPAALFFLLMTVEFKKAKWLICYFLLAFVLTNFLTGYAIVGHAFNPFGEKYTANVTSFFHINYSAFAKIYIPFLGHCMVLALFFAIPLMILSNAGKNIEQDKKNIHVYTIGCLISLVTITIWTTAQIVGWDPYEVINRLHLRYYNFIFPLFYIIAVGNLFAQKINYSFVFSLLVLIFMLFGFFILPTNFVISLIDGPELSGITANLLLYTLIIAIGLIASSLYMLKKKIGLKIYVYLFLPLTLFISNFYVNQQMRIDRLMMDNYDQAGIFAREYLGDQTTHLLVIGPERAGLFKTLFYIDNAKTMINELPLGTPIEFAKITKNTNWILTIGVYPTFHEPVLRLNRNGFTLIRLKE